MGASSVRLFCEAWGGAQEPSPDAGAMKRVEGGVDPPLVTRGSKGSSEAGGTWEPPLSEGRKRGGRKG